MGGKRGVMPQNDDWREKRYGRIRGGELEGLLTSLRESWREGRAIRESILEPEAIDFWKRVAAAPHWGQLYGLSLTQLLALLLKMTGTVDAFLSIAKSSNATEALLRDFPAELEKVELPDDPLAIPAILALIANLDSISRFSLTIHDLLERVKERHCVLSLARAASVDTGVLALPPAQLYMRSLQMAGETEALATFLRSVGGGPHKGRDVFLELRWAEYLLRDQGAFEECTFGEIHDLLVKRLRLYEDDGTLKDSKKSLAMVIRKWRKEAGN